MGGRTTRSGYLSRTIEGSHLSQGGPGQWAGKTHLNSDAKIADEGRPQGGEGTHKGCPYLLFSAKKPAFSRQRRMEFAIAHYDLHSSRRYAIKRGPTRGAPTDCLLFSAKKPASSCQRRMEFAIAHYDLHSSRRYALRRAPTRGAPTRFRQPHVGLSQFDAIALGIRAKTAIVLSGSLWSGRVAVPRLQHNGSTITIGLSSRPTLPQSVRRLPDRISRASSCTLAERMAAILRTRNWLFQPSLPWNSCTYTCLVSGIRPLQFGARPGAARCAPDLRVAVLARIGSDGHSRAEQRHSLGPQPAHVLPIRRESSRRLPKDRSCVN